MGGNLCPPYTEALSENNCPDWRRMFAQIQGGAEGA
jgi:hypothetical protein